MFCLNDTMRYYLCPGRTDMRKGISSLCGVVHEKMKSDVRNGDVFIFIGSSRKLMKLLHAEDGGMVMYVKRLEAGRFKLPEYDESTQSYPMEWRDLVMMVEEEFTQSIKGHYPMVEVMEYVVMPEHLHVLLMVHSRVESRQGRATHLGHVIAGFKKGCNRRFWEMNGLRGEMEKNFCSK